MIDSSSLQPAISYSKRSFQLKRLYWPSYMANFYFHSKWWPHYLVCCLCVFLDVLSPFDNPLWLHDITLKRNNCWGNIFKIKKKGNIWREHHSWTVPYQLSCTSLNNSSLRAFRTRFENGYRATRLHMPILDLYSNEALLIDQKPETTEYHCFDPLRHHCSKFEGLQHEKLTWLIQKNAHNTGKRIQTNKMETNPKT